MLIGIISGSGSDNWPEIDNLHRQTLKTPYGDVDLLFGRLNNIDVVHISRHGSQHHNLSNHVNHRANLSALISAGVDAVIGCTVCGAVTPSFKPGSLVVFDDLYFPSNRLPDGSLCTWYETAGAKERGHWIFDRSFSEPLRQALVDAGTSLDSPFIGEGVYAHIDGPRFNTRTEIAALSAIGVGAISQTAGPETILAGEAGLAYALVGFVTDYANGVTSEPEALDILSKRVSESGTAFARLIAKAMERLSPDKLIGAGTIYRVGQ